MIVSSKGIVREWVSLEDGTTFEVEDWNTRPFEGLELKN
jgi:hypothetical protein